MSCSHLYEGNNSIIQCKGRCGHDGPHYSYEKVSHNQGVKAFKKYLWNNNGEVPAQPVENGRAFQCDYDLGREERKKIMSLAIADARGTLPKGMVFEIRTKIIPAETKLDYGRRSLTRREMAENWGIAWYSVQPVSQPVGFEGCYSYTPDEPLFQCDVDIDKEPELGGYRLLARILC